MPDCVFAFELERGRRLALIPMAVRYRLDACRIKLSLRGWARLSLVQKEELLAAEVRTLTDREKFVQVVKQLGGDEVTPIAFEPEAVEDYAEVPVKVAMQCRISGVPIPTAQQWQALDRLAQYVLQKLARADKTHAAFLPAIREFGLIEPIPVSLE